MTTPTYAALCRYARQAGCGLCGFGNATVLADGWPGRRRSQSADRPSDGDAHAIKVTEACLAAHTLSPAYPAAVRHALGALARR